MDEEHIDECQQCKEYLDGWKRAQADYANLKKETEREKKEFSRYANERLLSILLPAIDQYDVALSHVPDTTDLTEEGRKRIENWIVGVKAVRSIWDTAFQEIGLERINVTGPFDPLIHDAAGEEESELPEQHVVRVVQNGWRLNGQLLRPAKVIISKHTS